MGIHGPYKRGIDLPFADQRTRKRDQPLVGSSGRISRKLKISRKPYGIGC